MNKIKNYLLIFTIIAIYVGIESCNLSSSSENGMTNYKSEIIKLPEPKYDSQTSVEEALLGRRSVRNYEAQPLTLAEISQLLWAAQGVTDSTRGWSFRTSPSAGALYPLELYIVAGKVNDLPDGIYKYKPLTQKEIKELNYVMLLLASFQLSKLLHLLYLQQFMNEYL